MADLTTPPGTLAQARVVAGLRIRILYNSLHRPLARLSLLGQAIRWLLGGFIALALGVGMGAAAFLSLRQGETHSSYLLLAGLLWVIFFLWQFVPLMLITMGAEFEHHLLLRYPLRFATFVVLSLGYGLLDEAAVLSLFALTCLAVGALAARPDLWMAILPLLVAFACLNLLLRCLVQMLLMRIVLRRRTRELFVVILFVGLLGVQLLLVMSSSATGIPGTITALLAAIAPLLPPSITAWGLVQATEGNVTGVVEILGWLGLSCLLCGVWLLLRYRRLYLGEESADEGRSGAAARPSVGVSPGWWLPGLSEPVAAMVQKEILYPFRIGTFWMVLVAVPAFVFIYTIFPRSEDAARSLLGLPVDAALPVAVAYCFLAFITWPANAFGIDLRGLQLLLFAPITLRQVLLAKNLAFSGLVLLESVTLWAVLTFTLGPPRLSIVLATYAAAAFLLLVLLAAGNLLSVALPHPVNLRGRPNAHPMALLAMMGLETSIGGLLGLAFYCAYKWDVLALAALLFAALGTGAYVLYRSALQVSVRLAQKRSDILLTTLCSD